METDDEAARERVKKRMAWVDALPPDLRACVHEYGLTVVKAFMDCGVTKAKHIHHLIATVREGSKEVGKRTDASPISDSRVPQFRHIPQ